MCVVDDKGAILFAIFGLTKTSHVDDPLRAVLSALEVRGGRCIFCGGYI